MYIAQHVYYLLEQDIQGLMKLIYNVRLRRKVFLSSLIILVIAASAVFILIAWKGSEPTNLVLYPDGTSSPVNGQGDKQQKSESPSPLSTPNATTSSLTSPQSSNIPDIGSEVSPSHAEPIKASPTPVPTPTLTLTPTTTPVVKASPKSSASPSGREVSPSHTPIVRKSPTPAPTRTPTPLVRTSPQSTASSSPDTGRNSTAGVSLNYANGNESLTSTSINPKFKLTNISNSTIKLSDIKIRYYYTIDGEKSQSFWCDWSSVGNSNVTGRFSRMSSKKSGADYYVEIGFTNGAGNLEPGRSIEVQTRFSKDNWSSYTQSNDYSFSSSASDYNRWSKVTLYISGKIVSGNEP